MLTQNAILYLVHYVFLPPQLPPGNDLDMGNETKLLDIVVDVLGTFGHCITPNGTGRTKAALRAIRTLRALRQAESSGAIDQGELVKALADLCERGMSYFRCLYLCPVD